MSSYSPKSGRSMRSVRRATLLAAAVLGLLGVSAGAFGGHALEGRAHEIWNTASRYHMWHSVALLATAAASPLWDRRFASLAALAWVVGTVLFSGSLYLLAITGLGFFGAVTPIGGVALLAGWILLVVAVFSAP